MEEMVMLIWSTNINDCFHTTHPPPIFGNFYARISKLKCVPVRPIGFTLLTPHIENYWNAFERHMTPNGKSKIFWRSLFDG